MSDRKGVVEGKGVQTCALPICARRLYGIVAYVGHGQVSEPSGSQSVLQGNSGGGIGGDVRSEGRRGGEGGADVCSSDLCPQVVRHSRLRRSRPSERAKR